MGARHRKGQSITPDFVVSLTLFVAVVSAGMMLWNLAYENRASSNDIMAMNTKAMYVSDILVRSAGFPEDWNSTNVELIGLAGTDHVLDKRKLIELKDIDYEQSRDLMGLGRYNYLMRIEYPNGTLARIEGPIDLEYGSNYADAEQVIQTTRIALLNSSVSFERVIIKFIVWR